MQENFKPQKFLFKKQYDKKNDDMGCFESLIR